MAKLFSIITKVDVTTNEEKIIRYSSYYEDEKKRERLLKKLRNLLSLDKNEYRLVFDKIMPMHIMNNISEQTVNELSKHIYSSAYVVYKNVGKKEEALYIAIFKDTAIRFKNSLPDAYIKRNNQEVPNPKYAVKEVRLLI